MSVFNPELRELSEAKWEKNQFSPDIEKKLLKALADGKEKFPDIVQCPNESCGNPLTIKIQDNYIQLSCTNCDWSNILRKVDTDSAT